MTTDILFIINLTEPSIRFLYSEIIEEMES